MNSILTIQDTSTDTFYLTGIFYQQMFPSVSVTHLGVIIFILKMRGNKSNKPFCLVITKIDELTNNDLKKSLVDLADNIGTEQEESCRKIMLEILSETHRDNMNQGSEFCSQVNKPNTTVKIFPIWTEGLSKEGKTIQPRTFGMDKFVNWCFGFDIVG